MSADTTDSLRQRLDTNLLELRVTWSEGPYYQDAEKGMEAQWRDIIYPIIKQSDFTRVLELAPGHGRNTEKLRQYASEIHLVDINPPCIEACRKRFAGRSESPRLHFHINDGAKLPMIASDSISFIYYWDAMVHFDPVIIREYIGEFFRVLKPGGTGFCHHSNFGALTSDAESNWMKNPAWRSTMSGRLFREYCVDAGLVVESQTIMDWGVPKLDCISTFRKPGA